MKIKRTHFHARITTGRSAFTTLSMLYQGAFSMFLSSCFGRQSPFSNRCRERRFADEDWGRKAILHMRRQNLHSGKKSRTLWNGRNKENVCPDSQGKNIFTGKRANWRRWKEETRKEDWLGRFRMGWLLVEISFGVRIIMRNRDIGECKLKITSYYLLAKRLGSSCRSGLNG